MADQKEAYSNLDFEIKGISIKKGANLDYYISILDEMSNTLITGIYNI